MTTDPPPVAVRDVVLKTQVEVEEPPLSVNTLVSSAVPLIQ
jgi:hypothetical protein